MTVNIYVRENDQEFVFDLPTAIVNSWLDVQPTGPSLFFFRKFAIIASAKLKKDRQVKQKIYFRHCDILR